MPLGRRHTPSSRAALDLCYASKIVGYMYVFKDDFQWDFDHLNEYNVLSHFELGEVEGKQRYVSNTGHRRDEAVSQAMVLQMLHRLVHGLSMAGFVRDNLRIGDDKLAPPPGADNIWAGEITEERQEGGRLWSKGAPRRINHIDTFVPYFR